MCVDENYCIVKKERTSRPKEEEWLIKHSSADFKVTTSIPYQPSSHALALCMAVTIGTAAAEAAQGTATCAGQDDYQLHSLPVETG